MARKDIAHGAHPLLVSAGVCTFLREYIHLPLVCFCQLRLFQAATVRHDLHVKNLEFARIKQLEDEQKDAEDFEHMTENLHHLVSTVSAPSVFKSPFGPVKKVYVD